MITLETEISKQDSDRLYTYINILFNSMYLKKSNYYGGFKLFSGEAELETHEAPCESANYKN